jgi:hypothetical protein
MGLMRLYSRLGTRNKTQGVETAGSHEDWRLATRPSQRGSRFLGHDLITINPGKSKIWLRRDAFRQPMQSGNTTKIITRTGKIGNYQVDVPSYNPYIS